MKKNSNSYADESVTEKPTKPASDGSSMSAGAEMLIERMKTNPDDFKFGGKFYRVVQAITDGQQWVSKRDRVALRGAYDATIVEPDFSEWVYGEIFNPKEPEPEPVQSLYAQSQGQKAQIQAQLAQQMTAVPNGLSSAPGSWTVSTGSTMANSLTLGNTTLSESMLTQIKNKLGL